MVRFIEEPAHYENSSSSCFVISHLYVIPHVQDDDAASVSDVGARIPQQGKSYPLAESADSSPSAFPALERKGEMLM